MRKFYLNTVCCVLFFGTSLFGQIPRVSGDLMSEVVSIAAAMPGSGSEGFVIPAFAALDKWTVVFSALLDAQYDTADSLLSSNFPFYELIEFTDTGYQNQVYYLLKEQTPVQRGWGTIIINPLYRREIAVEIPHPRYDTNTHREGTDVFRETGARFLLMSGTHRCANDESSACSGTTSACGSSAPYKVSDMAHYEKAVFQHFHKLVTDRLPGLYAINLHGHSRSTCEDFFMSSGVGSNPTQILLDIKNSLLAAGGVTAAVAGDGTSACTLTGGTNVQGRYTNGSSNPCSQAAVSPNGFFMHIEQTRYVRDNPAVYGKLIDALNFHIQPVTGFSETASLPGTALLAMAYPNPFNPQTTISITLPAAADVTLKIFDTLGKELATLFRGRLAAGKHLHEFDASRYGSGTYFAHIHTDRGNRVVRLVLLR